MFAGVVFLLSLPVSIVDCVVPPGDINPRVIFMVKSFIVSSTRSNKLNCRVFLANVVVGKGPRPLCLPPKKGEGLKVPSFTGNGTFIKNSMAPGRSEWNRLLANWNVPSWKLRGPLMVSLRVMDLPRILTFIVAPFVRVGYTASNSKSGRNIKLLGLSVREFSVIV